MQMCCCCTVQPKTVEVRMSARRSSFVNSSCYLVDPSSHFRRVRVVVFLLERERFSWMEHARRAVYIIYAFNFGNMGRRPSILTGDGQSEDFEYVLACSSVIIKSKADAKSPRILGLMNTNTRTRRRLVQRHHGSRAITAITERPQGP